MLFRSSNLLSSSRFARLVEQQALDGDSAYQPVEFLSDVRNGVWSELSSPHVKIDAYRRNLQRAYLDLAGVRINGTPAALPAGFPASFAALFVTSGDERPYYRAELRALNASVAAALPRTTDRATRVHLEGVRDQIARVLDPKFVPAAPSSGVLRVFGFQGYDSFLKPPEACWPDYVIRP